MPTTMKTRTIENIVVNNLCTGCGTCVGMCPFSSIKMVNSKGIFIPKIVGKCTNCGICLKVCAGYSFSCKKYSLKFFGKEPNDVLIGNYSVLFTGHAVDNNIRYNSASGGLVTALLISCLDEGMIDGVLITRFKAGSLEPESIIAKTRQEILSCMGSKYCPVPANIALKQIQNNTGRYAVVGLPCHIHGIRKAEALNKELSKKIVLHIGLFCSGSRNFRATDYLFWKFGVNKQTVESLNYRGEGWLGGMTIRFKDGGKRFYPYLTYNRIWKSYFLPFRCSLCCDHFSELSDISCGDIWLPEFMGDTVGTSAIISRSKLGDNIIDNAIKKHSIELKSLDKKTLIRSQKYSLVFKKKLLFSRVLILRMLRKKTPGFDEGVKKTNPFFLLVSLLFYIQIYLSSKRHLWPILAPLRCFLELYKKYSRL